jgi:dTDP-4-dehydrorhamnose 3,5-epimerase
MAKQISTNPVRLITPRRFSDDRGWFSETYSERRLVAIGLDHRFVQDNHSLSRAAKTLRGFHFQRPPHAQHKLVRCVRGGALDIAVDLRRGSPSYGAWVGAELSAENGRQLFIPVGFGHAFLTLEPHTEMVYKVSDYYEPDCEGGIRWNDPDIAVAWNLSDTQPHLSAKDSALPFLRDFDSPFSYDGNPLEPLRDQG